MELFANNWIFEFRLYYPDQDKRNIWKQSLNPYTTSSSTNPVEWYNPIIIEFTWNWWWWIEKSTSNSTLIDWNPNNLDRWNSIWTVSSWWDWTTFPWFNGSSVKQSSLYIK